MKAAKHLVLELAALFRVDLENALLLRVQSGRDEESKRAGGELLDARNGRLQFGPVKFGGHFRRKTFVGRNEAG